MTRLSTNLFALSGLVFLLAASEALPPQDVPVRCATICGPVVELSSKCTPLRALSRRDSLDAHDAWIGRRELQQLADDDDDDDDDQPDEQPEPQIPRHDDDENKQGLDRRFITLVPAPTTFAARYSSLLNPSNDENGDGGGDGMMLQEVSATRITPIVVRSTTPPAADHRPSSSTQQPQQPIASPSASPPPPPPAPSPASSTSSQQRPLTPPSPPVSSSFIPSVTANPNALTTNGASSSAYKTPEKALTTVSVTADPDRKGQPTALKQDSEEQCVCLNKSFDVARVASLCTSCILQSGFKKTNMRVVMSICNFSRSKYTPSDDAIVNNVRVSATRPTALWGHNAGVSNNVPGGHGMPGLSVGVVVMMVGLLLL